MIDTFMFDLDGTLLPLDMKRFTEIYFYNMGRAFADIIDADTLVKYIWISTEAMIGNDGTRTNSEAFMEVFSGLVKTDPEVYIRRFDKFYDEGFLETKKASGVSPLINDAVDILKRKGYDLIVATNPLFPEKAVLHRIEWAGLDPDDFLFITSYEKCSYCKPNVGFYREVLEKTDKQSLNCMMVGNDVKEDLAAAKTGMKTFLINDYIINKEDEIINSDYLGNYMDFHNFAKTIPEVYQD